MCAVVQRVSRARVTVAAETTGAVDRGFLVLLGVAVSDTREDALALAKKIVSLRVFEDDQATATSLMTIFSRFQNFEAVRRKSATQTDHNPSPHARSHQAGTVIMKDIWL